MAKAKFSVTHKDERILALMEKTDKRVLAMWARDCVERVMPYFEEAHPEDNRPGEALNTLQAWIDTGEFSMAIIRKASLNSHASAREIGEDNPARSVARSAGQAVATAHVYTHSIGAGNYALQAIYRDTDSMEAVEKEREWQYQRLLELSQEQSE